MEESSPNSESNPFVRRTWSWRHREASGVREPNDIDLAYIELLSMDAEEIQNSPEEKSIGLSSQEAHRRLFSAIKEELDAYSEASGMKWTSDILNTLKFNHRSCMSWISVGLLVFEICAMIASYIFSDYQRSSLPLLEGFLILLISLTNLVVCIREENYRRTEMYRSASDLLESYRVTDCNWNPLDYVDPCIPSSPAISLVHTYRDNELISMPCNLLVPGDVVALGPTHTAPARVQLIEESTNEVFNGSRLQLKKGEIFNPEMTPAPDLSENSASDEKTFSCNPHTRKRFLVTECPYAQTLRSILSNACSRPVSLLENEKHFITSAIIEGKLVWIILICSLLVNVIRLLLLDTEAGHWTEMIFLLQGYSILPVLPLAFPLLWYGLSLYGAARIKVMFDVLAREDAPDSKAHRNISMRDVLSYFWSNVQGDTSTLPRTTNLLHVLGNITVWCCVDKDGILSLPNPSVEKVFFLQSKKRNINRLKRDLRDRKASTCTYESDSSRQYNRDGDYTDDLSSSSSDDDEEVDEDTQQLDDGVKVKDSHLRGRAAVLNVSSDPESQFGLRFDDKRWQNHLGSLKPLGLNILLNSPCSSPVRCLRLSDCTSHLSLKYNPTPVPSHRRCLCLLGKEIGFMDRALSFFTKQQYIFAVQSTSIPVTNLPLQTSSYLAVCKERPVPNMACLLVKEACTGVHQLLTQGSADLVLDTCTEFWDGSNLCTISAHDRKKVLDFYQRNSMSSYCVAFAYRPVAEAPTGKSDAFLQFPPIFQWTSSSESDSGSASEMSEDEADEDEEDGGIAFSVHDLSLEDMKVDSLLNEVLNVEDPDTYHKLLGGQVFIGMTTLQYQAKKDVIPLVEDLNKAGIRFVYFSAEDELKSRVFAERMGLETGWNCHISLANSALQQNGHTDPGKDHETQGERANEEPGLEGEEKHVSWKDYHSLSPEKVEELRDGNDEADPGDDGELTTLLSSQTSARDDYWFFHNRAKLPRGVHNIRPHLENVDNVPLLVPLFTDSTPDAVQEMVEIMQEHGEVVCGVGSSFNVNNTGVFTQADISISIEPMFPQLCLKGLPKDFRSGTPQLAHNLKRDKLISDLDNSTSSDVDTEPSPLDVSAALNSLPCAFAFHRDRNFKFKTLIKEARRLCFGLRTCFAFMLACQLILTCINFLAQCLLLPPPLTGLHLLWLTCLTVPLLSLSLIASRAEKGIMSMMTGRNDNSFQGMCSPIYPHFTFAFLPTCCFVSVVLFPLTLRGFCTKTHLGVSKCHYLLGYRNSTEYWNGLGSDQRQVLALAQDVNAFFLVLFFVVTSTSFVHRLRSLWRGSPFTNRHWLCTVVIVLCLQILFFAVSQAFWIRTYGSQYSVLDLPSYVIALVFAWPFGTLAVTELLKRRYIKLWIRYQRRAKLMFGTKLGMNSPF